MFNSMTNIIFEAFGGLLVRGCRIETEAKSGTFSSCSILAVGSEFGSKMACNSGL